MVTIITFISNVLGDMICNISLTHKKRGVFAKKESRVTGMCVSVPCVKIKLTSSLREEYYGFLPSEARILWLLPRNNKGTFLKDIKRPFHSILNGTTSWYLQEIRLRCLEGSKEMCAKVRGGCLLCPASFISIASNLWLSQRRDTKIDQNKPKPHDNWLPLQMTVKGYNGK